MNPFIFRAYDVRGKLGMDNRTTSPPLKEAFGAGMLSTGLDVVDIGLNHTPLLYFATAHWKLDGGATVTGSHNPVTDNGVKMVHAGAAPLRVVVDAGNGIAGSFAPELLRRVGCEVTELYCESDGTFPHHLPDPEMEENVRDLVAKVVETRADVGIAYDGDADRMGVIDDRGRRHEADLILALL